VTVETMTDICIGRAQREHVVNLYEHEIGRLAKELAGSTWDFGKHRACTAAEVEAEIRSGTAMFYGVLVRCR